MHEEFKTVYGYFATDCSQLVKMVFEPEEWPAFASYMEDIKVLQSSFHSSELIHLPRTHNSRADSLAHSARKQPSFVVHMDAELPVWFTESIRACLLLKKKTGRNFNQDLLFNMPHMS